MDEFGVDEDLPSDFSLSLNDNEDDGEDDDFSRSEEEELYMEVLGHGMEIDSSRSRIDGFGKGSRSSRRRKPNIIKISDSK